MMRTSLDRGVIPAVTDRRILLAIEPTVLEGALASLVRQGRYVHVDELHKLPADAPPEAYDAVVATGTVPEGFVAPTLIILPDETRPGSAVFVVDGQHQEFSFDSLEQLLELLSETL